VTAQRLGAAIGITVIGTALFGSGSGGSGSGGSGGSSGASTVMPALVHHAGIATLVNLCFIVLALARSFGLPHRLAGSAANDDEETTRPEAGHQDTGAKNQDSEAA
jgi:hypothetical protein